MTDISWLGPAIDVRPLFAAQQAAFVDLLHGLSDDEWARPTICPGWNVKDVAAHVLGDHVGRLSIHRDGFHVLHPYDAEPFTVFLDRINEEWVTAARDFSEYWTHHQQICDATGRTGLTDPHYLGPVLDTFLRALPHTLHGVTAQEGTVLQVIVTGPGGRPWTCTRGPDRWRLRHQLYAEPAARLELPADTTWRLCTRGITLEQAAEHAHISGDEQLASAALDILSIMWTPPDPRQRSVI